MSLVLPICWFTWQLIPISLYPLLQSRGVGTLQSCIVGMYISPMVNSKAATCISNIKCNAVTNTWKFKCKLKDIVLNRSIVSRFGGCKALKNSYCWVEMVITEAIEQVGQKSVGIPNRHGEQPRPKGKGWDYHKVVDELDADQAAKSFFIPCFYQDTKPVEAWYWDCCNEESPKPNDAWL